MGDKWRIVGEVSIESGALLLSDPCYRKTPGIEAALKRLISFIPPASEECLRGAATWTHQPTGVVLGTIVNTGGDGTYKVKLKRDEDGLPLAVLVEFRKPRRKVKDHERQDRHPVGGQALGWQRVQPPFRASKLVAALRIVAGPGVAESPI